ncbi:MAG: sulfotransferase domain-containing protein [Xenococcaceae cyanobacterium MO_207.B15]|nr:sulfotransferase domain-containing protein [Xenococcaceae cyanobacterium MO_207.B15]MDJ0744808.1 sulfotransferase domain-containing protein [Xenococcaceae cyanobacterium MO_167.B27]
MNNKRIIVCGYPKSGNTWLTRLTAEILGCSVVGFWCEPFNKEEAIEGRERDSNYQCFKAHHNIDQMNHTFAYYANGSEKIIYIVRDPRDVVVSASYYFSLKKPRYKRIYNFMSLVPYGLSAYYKLFHTQKYKLDTLTRILLKGANQGQFWLRVPWKDHVMGYLKSSSLLIRYEDLRAEPISEAKRICEYLNIERSEKKLMESIYNQSFEKKKKMFLDSSQLKNASFLRKGTSGEWNKMLSAENIKMINEELGDFLAELGYQ